MYTWHFMWGSGAEQKHKDDGWLAFVTTTGTRCFWLQFPWPGQKLWESLFSLSPWEGPLKFTAHNVLLAVGRNPGNFRQMKLAMLQWFRLQWPRLQGNTEWNSTLCNMVSEQWHGDQDGNLIKHPWTSQTNQDWYGTGYQKLQNCSQCSTGCGQPRLRRNMTLVQYRTCSSLYRGWKWEACCKGFVA